MRAASAQRWVTTDHRRGCEPVLSVPSGPTRAGHQSHRVKVPLDRHCALGVFMSEGGAMVAHGVD